MQLGSSCLEQHAAAKCIAGSSGLTRMHRRIGQLWGAPTRSPAPTAPAFPQTSALRPTLTSVIASKPSSWLSSSSMVRWISRSPPLCASYRLVPTASISSAQQAEGWAQRHTLEQHSAAGDAPRRARAKACTRQPRAGRGCLHRTTAHPRSLQLSGEAGAAGCRTAVRLVDPPMNTMEGACSSATRNSSRTSLGPSPRYFWISSDPTCRVCGCGCVGGWGGVGAWDGFGASD